MKQKTNPGLKIISNNRKAHFNYSLTEFCEIEDMKWPHLYFQIDFQNLTID